MKTVISTVSAVIFISILSSSPALTATIHVPADQSTIQAGIVAAVDGDLVLVAPGTYFENIDFIGKAITVRSEARDDVTIVDGGQAGTVVTFISGEMEESIIDGFTIQNGSGTIISSYSYGGGLYCSSSSPTIANCTITENSSERYGGGIYCDESSPKIMDCTISRNNTFSEGMQDYQGGGIYCFHSFPTITGCTITENSTFSGGGISSDYGSPWITNCIISQNIAAVGGGIRFMEGYSNIENCEISGNVALQDSGYGMGGGIYLTANGLDHLVEITNCAISGNSAASGGGIYMWANNIVISNCTLSGNSSYSGGGVHDRGCTFAIIKNCIFINNNATGFGTLGGGLRIQGGTIDTSMTIVNCTFAGNYAHNGGGIYSGHNGDFNIVNTILWGNSANGNGPEINLYDSTNSSVRYSDIQGGLAEIWIYGTTSLDWGAGNIDSNPLFVGGGDYQLTIGSLCIDAGDPDPAYNDLNFPPSMGTERNDMGAYGGPGVAGWITCWDNDGDGYYDEACGGDDCYDTDLDSYPSAPEICDGFDNDCDGVVPEDEADVDGDG